MLGERRKAIDRLQQIDPKKLIINSRLSILIPLQVRKIPRVGSYVILTVTTADLFAEMHSACMYNKLENKSL